MANAPWVDETGRLMPWAVILMTQVINGISGGGGIIDIATLGAFPSASPPTSLPPISPSTTQRQSTPAIAPPPRLPTPGDNGVGPRTSYQTGITVLLNGARVMDGYGSPSGQVVGAIGDIYLRRDGGTSTTLYVCEAAGTAGWVAK